MSTPAEGIEKPPLLTGGFMSDDDNDVRASTSDPMHTPGKKRQVRPNARYGLSVEIEQSRELIEESKRILAESRRNDPPAEGDS